MTVTRRISVVYTGERYESSVHEWRLPQFPQPDDEIGWRDPIVDTGIFPRPMEIRFAARSALGAYKHALKWVQAKERTDALAAFCADLSITAIYSETRP
jgi:hypothetical protein